jgi:RecB family endonuclease NucS
MVTEHSMSTHEVRKAAAELTEKELATELERTFLPALSLTLIGREVRIGKYRLDALARDRGGDLVVIELKVAATKDAIAQLLLYPHAVTKTLFRQCQTLPSIRSVLISTHLDRNVVELVESLKLKDKIGLFVCIGNSPNELRLVEPSEAGDRVWCQSDGRTDLVVENGEVHVRRN